MPISHDRIERGEVSRAARLHTTKHPWDRGTMYAWATTQRAPSPTALFWKLHNRVNIDFEWSLHESLKKQKCRLNAVHADT